LVHTPQVNVPTPPTPHIPPTPPPPPTPQSVPQTIPEHAPAPTNDSPTMSIHPMVTHSHVRSTHPNPRYAGHVSTISPLPRSYKEAFNDPNWQNAMFDDRYKARLVDNGSTQVEGVDVDENFSPVVKPGTIRTVLSLVISRHCPVHQLDRSLYGLKQAPRAWFQRFAGYITTVGFTPSRCDSSLFIYKQGISVTLDSSSMFLSQRKYAIEILERAHMVGCNPSRTHVDTETKLGDGGTSVVDPTLYWSLAGSLRYLTFTRPDITYAVQQAGCLTMQRSTSGYCVFLGNNLLSWSSKRQPTLSRSSVKAEYRGVANAVTKTCWIRNLLRELHTPLSSATIVYCDNVRILHVPSRFQYEDIFTKGLPSALFDEFHDNPNTKMVVIWNPTIRKSVCIDILVPEGRYTKEECIVVGIGVCPDTSDLKLVKIIDDKISSISRLNLVISFDLKSEKFGEVCLPERLVHTPNLNVKRKDDVNNQFTKIYTIKVEGKWLFDWVLRFRSNGEVVMELDADNYKESRISIYEPLSRHINDVGINGDLRTLYAWSYMETLLLLDEADSIIL
nr:hypothetical protein [Tanacetum cinerariifolium]